VKDETDLARHWDQKLKEGAHPLQPLLTAKGGSGGHDHHHGQHNQVSPTSVGRALAMPGRLCTFPPPPGMGPFPFGPPAFQLTAAASTSATGQVAGLVTSNPHLALLAAGGAQGSSRGAGQPHSPLQSCVLYFAPPATLPSSASLARAGAAIREGAKRRPSLAQCPCLANRYSI